jgi:hypothetical protein
VLQAQFAIVWYPARCWSHDQMWEVMQACMIMHNMIIENDRKTRVRHVGPYECQGPLAEVDHQVSIQSLLISSPFIRISVVALFTFNCNVLVKHLWRLKEEAATASAP